MRLSAAMIAQMRFLRTGAVFLSVLFLLATAAYAAVLPGAGGFSNGRQSHAWVVLPLSNYALLHLPPRSGNGPVEFVEAGSTRLATAIYESPEMAAAWENTVYICFRPTAVPPSRSIRRVLSLSALPAPMGSVWTFDNSGGRMKALPALPGEGDLISFVGSAGGPVAMLRQDGALRVLALDGSGWRPIELPEGLVLSEPLRLVSLPRGVGLFSMADEAALWTGQTLEQSPVVEGAELPLPMMWTRRGLSVTAADGSRAPPPDGPVFQCAGVLVYTARQSPSGPVEVWNPTAQGAYRLAVLEGVGPQYALAPLDDVGRLALVWTTYERPPEEGKSGKAGRAASSASMDVSVIEVAVSDGEIFYLGPALQKGPVSSEELKLLAVALVGMMALILLFVLKPEESRGPVHLPQGVALAEPGRRMLAALLDLGLAATVTSALTGRGIWELLLLSGVFSDPAAIIGLLSMLGMGFVLSTLGEWLFGRSVGKALTGCAVALPRLVEMPDQGKVATLAKPTLWRAAVRNLVKWFVPPVAVMGLSGPDFRHRGDIAAGTVVVVAMEDRK